MLVSCLSRERSCSRSDPCSFTKLKEFHVIRMIDTPSTAWENTFQGCLIGDPIRSEARTWKLASTGANENRSTVRKLIDTGFHGGVLCHFGVSAKS